MASWKEERDRLVAQTIAFVQQVAAAHPRATDADHVDQRAIEERSSVSTIAETTSSGGPPSVATSIPEFVSQGPIAGAAQVLTAAMLPDHALYSTASERADIIKRVATFKARQSQIGREREAYYETMQDRIRASLGNVSSPDRL